MATSQTAGNIGQGNIAYISCDPSTYPGNIDGADTINAVVSNHPGAIVLFSNSSTSCSFTATDGFTYNIIYTMVEANTSALLQMALEQGHTQSGTAEIGQSSSEGNETTSNAGNPAFGGHSPTTAVAMIILYSITGIITALFLIIIVVGAIRAHRHPERYGPQNMLGRPRQSRARGIARAMLDTLPIVKFGEKEEKPESQSQAPQTRDMELGNTREAQPDQRSAENQRTSLERRQVVEHPAHEGPEPVVAETVAATEVSTGEAQTDSNADNGLACSVCTDDFVKGQDIRVLPCNHNFHPECIDPWLLNVSGTCPLCRVDLRPTASHTDEMDDPDAINSTEDVTASADSLSPDEASDGTARRRQRRSRTGLSLYIQHTLNRGRMRDATPEERLAALRRIRTANRSADGEGGSTRNRLSARISRAFDPERRHSSHRGSYAG